MRAHAAQALAVPDLSACDGAHATVLFPEQLGAARPADKEMHQARAAWLDGRTLRWGGAPAEGHFRLYASPTGSLRLDADRVEGAATVLTLQAAAPRPHAAGSPVPYPRDRPPGSPAPAGADSRRFSHIGTGPELQVRTEDARQVPALLRGQVLLTREDAHGRVLQATQLQHAGALDALYARAEEVQDLGAHVRGRRTTFGVWAPTAQRAHLCLYERPDGPATALHAMAFDAATGLWRVTLPQDLRGQGYAFLVDVPVRGTGLVRNLVSDPYALGLIADSRRSVVVDLRDPALQPPEWRQHRSPKTVQALTDLMIYELHVRDFSIGDDSVSAQHRGKYLAFTETGSRGMQHLRRLAEAGMTDVHLLPVFDIASIPEAGCVTPDVAELRALARAHPDGPQVQDRVGRTRAQDCFNWGYDPWHYTVPEGSYATDPQDPRARIVEFRRMVQALHRTGLRVGMDVVYNHTSASGQHPQSVLDRLVPGYYHRLNAQGEVERSTCCDNTATEHRMMAKLMIDSAVVWARDYRIDSFRFDLMGHQPREAMERLQRAVNRAAGRPIALIGEGWNFGEVADGRRFVQAAQGALNGSGIATFSDRGRDAVRGGGCCDSGPEQVWRQGWVNGLHYDENEEAAARAERSPDAAAERAARERQLRHLADLVRVALAGTLKGVPLRTASGEVLPAGRIDYAGQGAGYASQPGEVVNYVENHDNQTLFDLNAFKLPRHTSREDRARVQHLANAVVVFSQGVAYFHAGQELLRSKSMDRNSYDSGDWFNRLDWSGTDNGFAAGLPPHQDNEGSWPMMAPRLADPMLRPTPADIAWTREAFLDLLRIRRSTSLLRLRTAQQVQQRLRFLDAGAHAGTVLGVHLDGRGHPGAGYPGVVLLLNVDKVAHNVSDPALAGQAYALHPALAAPQAADGRARQARFEPATGRFEVPARTAVVFVRLPSP